MKSIVENKIFILDEEVSYIIDYKNIKNIYFRFDENGILRVSANKMLSKKYIELLILKNQKSIFKLKERVRRKNNGELSYLGNPLNLILFNGKTFIDGNDIYAKSLSDAKIYLYTISLGIFETRLKKISNGFEDLPNFRLKSRLMKTKWGVCNKGSMTVTLNQALIMKDVHLIDYVIVHELSHFKYMNHSQDFWDEVAKHYPDYKKARKELNY